MAVPFQYLTQESLSSYVPPKTGNGINFSSLYQLETPGKQIEHLSLKFVVDGIENYTLNDKTYQVQPNNLLIAQSEQFCRFFIDSKTPIEGLCMSIDNKFMHEIVASYCNLEMDEALLNFYTTNAFQPVLLQNKSSELFENLIFLANKKKNDRNEQILFQDEFFYHIGELVIRESLPVFSAINQVNAQKWQTKKMIYTKMLEAKGLIESELEINLAIPEIAKRLQLTTFHFIRCFKAVYGCSPYQFQLETRLNKSIQLIKSGNYSITDVADELGFADLPTFSKAFKRKFGCSPKIRFTQ